MSSIWHGERAGDANTEQPPPQTEPDTWESILDDSPRCPAPLPVLDTPPTLSDAAVRRVGRGFRDVRSPDRAAGWGDQDGRGSPGTWRRPASRGGSSGSDGSEDGREGSGGLAFGGDHILELSGLSEDVEDVEVRSWIERYGATRGRRRVQPSLSCALLVPFFSFLPPSDSRFGLDVLRGVDPTGNSKKVCSRTTSDFDLVGA